jgi:hypothetical protein
MGKEDNYMKSGNIISKFVIITEITVELRSPQHRPETMRLIYAPKNEKAYIDYGGRMVNPGRPSPGQKPGQRKPYYHYQPGKKPIPVNDFLSIAELLRNNNGWYREKPKDHRENGLQLILSVKTSSKDDSPDTNIITVKSSYFDREVPSEEFKEIFSEAVKIYGGERGILEPSKYD